MDGMAHRFVNPLAKCNQISNFQISGLALGLLYSSVSFALPCDFKNGDYYSNICGYLAADSAVVGGKIKVHVSTQTPEFDVQIRRAGSGNPILQSTHFTNGKKYTMSENGYAGLNWGGGHPVDIPSDWKSGIYEIVFNNNIETQPEYVAIRSNNPGSYSKVLVLDSVTTNMAYSSIGGKSLYGFNSSNSQATTRITTERPVGQGLWAEHRDFVTWLDKKGIAYEAASMMDIQRDPSLLKYYNLVILVGHNEYWSKTMRDAWDNYLAGGGNAAIFSGNTMWWQVRFSANLKEMICYKSSLNDPQANSGHDDTLTVNWYNAPVNHPENSSTGVSFRHGGYHDYTDNGVQHYVKGSVSDTGINGGFKVTDASHWVFAGTGLANNDIFGRQSGIAGYEVDGALFKMVDGKPVVTGEDGTPTNFQILALTPAFAVNSPSGVPGIVANGYKNQGWGTVGIFKPSENSGTVFVAPTVDWAEGLAVESTISRITENVIERLKTRETSTENPDDGNNGNGGNTDNGGNTGNNGNNGGNSGNNGSSITSGGGGGTTSLFILILGLATFMVRKRFH